MKLSVKIFILLISLTVASTLVISNLFIYQSLTSLFLFTLLISVITLVLILAKVLSPSIYILQFSWPMLLFILWAIYILLYPLLTGNYNGNLKDKYLLNCILFYGLLIIIFSSPQFPFHILFRVIFGLGVIEAIICTFQFFNLFGSFNAFFEITGTQVNPNTTAMFLVMASATGFGLWAHNHKVLTIQKSNRDKIPDSNKFNKISSSVFYKLRWAGLAIIALAIIFLRCRSAYIGLAIVLAIVLYTRYNWLSLSLIRKDGLKSFIGILSVTLFLVLAAIILYKMKEASSEGRLTIWKISSRLFVQKPITGFGYGLFERNYNLYQAIYFNEGLATQKELANAGHVRMAYNEFIENGIEGGLLGSLLFTGVLVTLICRGNKLLNTSRSIQNKTGKQLKNSMHNPPDYVKTGEIIPAFAGICAFTAMSFVNFTIQAVPVMCLFIVYAAVLSGWSRINNQEDPQSQSVKFSLSGLLKKQTLAIITFLIAAFYFISVPILKNAKGQFSLSNQIKKADRGTLIDKKQIVVNLKSMKPLLGSCEGYHQQMGRLLVSVENFNDAIESYTESTLFTSNPDVFINLGFCYEKVGQKEKAEKNYKQALAIVPTRFLPHYKLMTLYLQNGDTVMGQRIAERIVIMKPKKISKEILFIKSEAVKALKNLNINQ